MLLDYRSLQESANPAVVIDTHDDVTKPYHDIVEPQDRFGEYRRRNTRVREDIEAAYLPKRAPFTHAPRVEPKTDDEEAIVLLLLS